MRKLTVRLVPYLLFADNKLTPWNKLKVFFVTVGSTDIQQRSRNSQNGYLLQRKKKTVESVTVFCKLPRYDITHLSREKEILARLSYAKLLGWFDSQLQKTNTNLTKKKVVIHDDNPAAQPYAVTMANSVELGYKLQLHSPYALYLVSCNFFSLLNLSKWRSTCRMSEKIFFQTGQSDERYIERNRNFSKIFFLC